MAEWLTWGSAMLFWLIPGFFTLIGSAAADTGREKLLCAATFCLCWYALVAIWTTHP